MRPNLFPGLSTTCVVQLALSGDKPVIIDVHPRCWFTLNGGLQLEGKTATTPDNLGVAKLWQETLTPPGSRPFVPLGVTALRWPRSTDILVLRDQELNPNSITYGQIEDGIRKLIFDSGIERINNAQFIPINFENDSVSNILRSFSQRFEGDVGIMVVGLRKINSQSRWSAYAVPCCCIGGKFYRILGLSKKLSDQVENISNQNLEEELSKILVPSIVVSFGSTRYVLMSIIEDPQYVDKITQDQLDGFVRRLHGSKMKPDIELISVDRPDSNLVIINNELYLIDAGDMLKDGCYEKTSSAKTINTIRGFQAHYGQRIRRP